MIGFPQDGDAVYDFIRKQTKDQGSKDMRFPAEYMFKNVPRDLPTDDPVSVLLHEMDTYGIEVAMIGVDELSRRALKLQPGRFVPSGSVTDPNDVTGSVRRLRRDYEEFGIRAVGAFPSGTFPQVAIDDPKMYPVYQTCVDLDIPIFCCAGVPGPRLKFAPQEAARIDTVMYDFPDLVFVTRHGCEPWEQLAVKLMLKWPNLWACRSSASSPTCQTFRSRTMSGPSSCPRMPGASSRSGSRSLVGYPAMSAISTIRAMHHRPMMLSGKTDWSVSAACAPGSGSAQAAAQTATS
jgi:hypothetical protein